MTSGSRAVEATVPRMQESRPARLVSHLMYHCWIENHVETLRIIDKMNSIVHKALNQVGIGIPVPQRELYLASTAKVERVNGAG